MRTIALVFGDNDFGNTFRPLLESVYRAFDWNGELSEEVVKAAVYAGIEFHYLAFQHARHFGQPGYGSLEQKIEYLRGVRVLFDEEAEADICNPNGHNAGAWYLELATGQVTAY